MRLPAIFDRADPHRHHYIGGLTGVGTAVVAVGSGVDPLISVLAGVLLGVPAWLGARPQPVGPRPPANDPSALLFAALGTGLAENPQVRDAILDAIRGLKEQRAEKDAPPAIDHALARLQAGDPAEAESVFAEVLERKSAEGLAANREAAEAARHLASLNLLHSMDNGLAHSERAVQLDPSSIEAWLVRGLVCWSAGLPTAARDAYQQALDLDPPPRNRAVALASIGDAEGMLGNLARATTLHEEANIVFQQLAARDPANSGWQRDLSVSFNRIGDVQVAKGNLDDALAAFVNSLAIRKELAAHDPANTEWQRDLSVSFNKIGDVQVAKGNLDDALASYQQSHRIFETLAARDPVNTGWQRDLSVSFNKIGDVQRAKGNLDDALASYQNSLAIREELAARDPANTEWQRDLSVSFNKIGDVQRAKGNLDHALAAYQRSLAIGKELAARDPANAGWQRDLSVSFDRIGDVQVAKGNLDGALASYQNGLAIREELAARDPANTGWQRDLIVSHWKLADLAERQDKNARALEHWQAALKITLDLEGSGRLAPPDAYFADTIRARLAALTSTTPDDPG